jgi:predicted nucleotidyltransferase
METEKQLNELVLKLKQGAAANLRSVVLYGSAVTGEFHPEHSDLNVLCVLEHVDAAELGKLSPAAAWWARKGHPAPLVFSQGELRQFADIFAIELVDIKANHRVLHGEDDLAALEVPMRLHSAQVERELSAGLIRLRRGLLVGGRDPKALLALMTSSVSAFATLFRHALVILGESPPERKREIFDRLAKLLGFNGAPFDAILDVREGKRRPSDVNVAAIFASYLEGATRVTQEIDRRLASSNP